MVNVPQVATTDQLQPFHVMRYKLLYLKKKATNYPPLKCQDLYR